MCAEQRDDIVEQLSAYLDGELGEQKAARLERLLETDPQLRRLLEELSKTAEWVRELPVEAAPAGLRESTVAVLERDMLLGSADDDTAALPRRSRPVLRWLATAAVVGLACTAGYFTFSRAGRGRSAGDEGSTMRTVQITPDELVSEQHAAPPESRLGKAGAPPMRSEAEMKAGSGKRDMPRAPRLERDRLDAQADTKTALAKRPAADVVGEPLWKGPQPRGAGHGKGPEGQGKPGGVVTATDGVPEALRVQTEPSKDEAARKGRVAVAPEQAAGRRVLAAYPVRLDVEVDSPARMYAMVGRARSTVAAAGWEMLDVAPPVTATGLMQTVPEGADAHRAAPVSRSARGRGRVEEPRAVHKLVLRGRRSQFVRLIEELHGQDEQARVQLISDQNAVCRGWPQVAAAAERVGSLAVPAEASAQPDFAEDNRLPGVFESPSAVNRMPTKAEQTPPAAPIEERSAAVTAAEGGAERDKESVLRQLSDAAYALDGAAGYRPQAKSGEQAALGESGPDQVASQPGTRASGQPESTEPQGSGLADSFLAMMQQIDATLDPDPVLEVTLTVRAVPPATDPAPAATAPAGPQFEPAPELRIDRSREAAPDQAPALGIDGREKH